MQICELLVTNQDGTQKVAALILFDGKRISGLPANGYKNLLLNVLDEPVYVDGEETEKDDDPEKWFNSLPMQYNGTYLRAKLVSYN